MPSYRVTLAVGLLQPGAGRAAVLRAAAAAARALATGEAYEVGGVRGEARVTVRFLADTDASAHGVADAVEAGVRAHAATSGGRLTRRWGARWRPA